MARHHINKHQHEEAN